MKYIKICLFIVVCTSLFQCTKDECITHVRLTDEIGNSLFLTELPSCQVPYFNPNNSNEIIFGCTQGTFDTPKLIKYNLENQAQEIIYEGDFLSKPRWSKKGWILLNLQDSLGRNIYKIKSDGSELTALTTSGNCFYPEWDIKGEKIIYRYAFSTKGIVIDEAGIFLDTLNCSSNAYSSWQHPTLSATGNSAGLNIVDPYDCGSLEWLYEANGVTQSAGGAEWLDEERIFWCHVTGIYITNIITKETEVVRETCNAYYYQRPSYAPDIDKIIIERVERIVGDGDEPGSKTHSFVLMNPDGSEETLIDLN